MDKYDRAFDGQTRYRISYYDRIQCCRVYYLNNSTFSNLQQAEREVELIKKHDTKRGYKVRIRFNLIEPYIVKNAINKPIK